MALSPEEEDDLRKKLEKNHIVAQFVKSGNILLQDTNKPNIITIAQFAPYVELFQRRNPTKIDRDPALRRRLALLAHSWKFDLGMNLYELTHIIESEENPKIIHTLNRAVTRIKGDSVPNPRRDALPPTPVHSPVSHDELAILAIYNDIKDANFADPEMKEHFRKIRNVSRVINENTAKLQRGEDVSTGSTNAQSSGNGDIVWDDDDDD